MKFNKIKIIIVVVLSTLPGFSQDILTKKDALKITLENNFGVKVSTVEHLLAALYIAEIDNAIIEIDNEEVPIMDGSSKNFIEGIFRAGVKSQIEKRKFIKVQNEIHFLVLCVCFTEIYNPTQGKPDFPTVNHSRVLDQLGQSDWPSNGNGKSSA